MSLVIIAWLAVAALELGQSLPGVWRVRIALACSSLFLGALTASWLLAWRPNLFTALLAVLSAYRIFNQVRILQARMHEEYLRRSARRTTIASICLQLLLALAWLAWRQWSTDAQTVWIMITSLQLLGAIVLLLSIARRLRRTSWPARVKQLVDSQLPTVTVAIPARNETEDLEQCLQSVIASNYPKLEILVLDDCSQTKQTPEVIRSFAHDGVRFVQGKEPHDTWLPKTQAYARLAEEASGHYMLFCGADIRFAPQSIRQVVSIMQAKHKRMMSVLPLRASRQLALTQAMRYFWELVPPRRLFRRPPVLSSCWIIETEALQQAGGFAAVTRSIVPEAHFARDLLKTDSYSFMRASQASGITSTKSQNDQRETAIRMRYPQLHRRPENVLITSAAGLFFLVLPFVQALAGSWLAIGGNAQLRSVATAVVLIAMYELMGLSTRVTTWWFGLIALPIVVVHDVIMLHISMWQYEFSVVEWKGRNICIPAMHVIPRLPKLD